MNLELNQDNNIKEIIDLIRNSTDDDALRLALEDYHDKDLAEALEELSAEERKKQLMDKNTLMTNMTKEFPDVAGNHWAHQAVTTLHGNGILQGYPDGEFKGNKSMTRYEYAEMLFNAMIKGNNMDPKMVKEYRPELEKVARKANRPEVLKKYISTSTPASDKAMQEAGQRYNKAMG